MALEETNGHPASRASVASVERKVDTLDGKVDALDAKVLTLNNALVGVPGISDGVIEQLRKQNTLTEDRLIALQTSIPTQINAAIDERVKDKTITHVTNARSWMLQAAQGSVAVVVGVLLNIVWLHFGGGSTPLRP